MSLRHGPAAKVLPNGHTKSRQGESAKRGDDLNTSGQVVLFGKRFDPSFLRFPTDHFSLNAADPDLTIRCGL